MNTNDRSKHKYLSTSAISKGFVGLLIVNFLFGCSPEVSSTNNEQLSSCFTQYSEFVNDSFYINVQLPQEYFENPDKNYPTLYELDGNFYLPITAPIIHQFEQTGLLNPLILVSIGYTNFKTMDSLRVRDYLYPKSIPSDEMDAVGGAQKFKKYIVQELIPKIDKKYRTDISTRILFGHSFGGYFVLYALSAQLENGRNDFKSFISTSPTLWYNNFYLNHLPEKLSGKTEKLNLFLSVGGNEDSIWMVKPVIDISKEIKTSGIQNVTFKNRVYSDLDHMDVGLTSFFKGLQELDYKPKH